MMDIETARKLTSGCVKTAMRVIIGGKYVPLPEASLADLLEANEIVAAQPPERIDGGVRLSTHCDPRLIALHYAFEQYGSDPHQMLENLGFEVAVAEDD